MMADLKASKQGEKDTKDTELIIRERMEFDLYTSANRFISEEILKEKEYRISKTRLENLSRALRISYPVFIKLLNNCINRLKREGEDDSSPRGALAKREWEALKMVQDRCSTTVLLEKIPLEREGPTSRAERRWQGLLREEYAGRMAQAWFNHFTSAYSFKVPPDEQQRLSDNLKLKTIYE